jgi:uncharacterized membrane protein YsdA (DUF1294 family)/cold shock CspA family protein
VRHKGKITSWNDSKGFGFITPNSGGKQIFIHIKAFSKLHKRPAINQIVTFDISKDKQGRVCAVNASRLGDKTGLSSKSRSVSFSFVLVSAFSFIIAASVWLAELPIYVLAFYAIAGIVTYALYAVDKSAARKGNYRTPEITLHFLSLVGGWPGALIAQQKLRHKTKKQSFRAVFWLTVLINCSVVIWLMTHTDYSILYSLLDNS